MPEKGKLNSMQKRLFWSIISRAGFSGSLLLSGGCIYLLYVLEQVPRVQPAGQLSAAAWPRFMLVASIAIALGNVIRTLVTCVRERRCPSEGIPSVLDKELDGKIGFGVLENFVEKEIKEVSSVKGEVSPQDVKLKRDLKVVIGAASIIFLFILLMNQVGFAIANVLFMVGFLFFMGERKPLRLILLPLISTVVFLYIFLKVIYISLPLGKGVFGAVTVGLYKSLQIF